MVSELNENDFIRIRVALEDHIDLLRERGQDILVAHMTRTLEKVNAIIDGEMHVVQG